MNWPFEFPAWSVLAGACIGHAVSFLLTHAFQHNRPQERVNDESMASAVKAKNIEAVASSLYALTSQVDGQVEQHSERVSEITHALDTATASTVSAIHEASSHLHQANRQLQQDLQDARSEIQCQREQMELYRDESVTDALAGLPNRGAFDRQLMNYACRGGRVTSSLILIDIDHSKKINDRHGHLVGDQVLKSFARTSAGMFDETEFVARFGGEEFAAILHRTPLDVATEMAERVRLAIANAEFRVGELNLAIKASFGIFSAIKGDANNDWVTRADSALYAAKHSGRNCCGIHDGNQSQIFHDEQSLQSEKALLERMEVQSKE